MLLGAQLFLLLFLPSDHVLHGLGLELVGLLLHLDHLLMLHALLLQSFGFSFVAVRLVLLVDLNGGNLVVTLLFQLISLDSVFPFFLPPMILLLLVGILVSLTHFHNVDSFFLSVLDFFPCLQKRN